MKTIIKPYIFTIVVLIFSLISCDKSSNDTTPIDNNNNNNTEIGLGLPGVVGTKGISDWDALPAKEKDRIKGWNTLFLHQSVGQDIEEGCAANGFSWEYFGNGIKIDKGLMGGIFVDVGKIPNGDPYEKIRVFKEQILSNKEFVKIGIFKFGYADIDDNNYTQVQVVYQAMVEELKAKVTDLRIVHVTPPLVYSVQSYDGNAARMKVGQWMRSKYASIDVIFDLQALESNDGQCQEGGVWRICPQNRNSATDPSDVNGVDTSDGQGHIGKNAGQRISKALLMSIYNSGK